MKDVFSMKVITHTITHQAKSAGGQIESIMYPVKFACGYSHSIMYSAKFAGRQIESIMYPAKFAGGRSRLDLLLPSFLPSREEKKKQERIFCPLWGHVVGRMPYAPTSYRQETLFPINSQEERIETEMQERRNQSIDSGAEWHTPFMRQGKRDAVWREAFLEQRAHVAVWRDRRLEERSSHARFQLKTFGENSKPYKSSLVALSEQLRDIFTA